MRIIARLNVGGPALHCIELSKGMSAHGFDTTLVAGIPAEGEASYEDLFKVELNGFRFVRFKKMSRMVSLFGDLETFWNLVKLMRQERPDIVHTHTAKAGLLGRAAAFLTGVPIVIHTFHGHVLSGYFSPFMSEAIRLIEKLLGFGTTAIITLSPALKKELSEKFRVARPESFRVVPLGRNLSTFLSTPRRRGKLRHELGLTDDRAFLLGTVGRLVPIKDQKTLIHAFSLLKSAVPSHLAIAGQGELADGLKQFARERGVSDRVHFIGWRNDLADLYSDFDVFVLSSLNEGTPLSIIESFAAGCPVVSTRVGGVSDLFSPTATQESQGEWRPEGALVPPSLPEALAAAIQRLIDDRGFAQGMSDRCRESAADFTTERLVERMSALYRELTKPGVALSEARSFK